LALVVGSHERHSFVFSSLVSAVFKCFNTSLLRNFHITSSAWWGFATGSDKHRTEAFVRRGVRLQLCGAADPTPTQLAEDADETFRRKTDLMFFTGFFPNPTAINIICALDGITFHYQLKQMIGTS